MPCRKRQGVYFLYLGMYRLKSHIFYISLSVLSLFSCHHHPITNVIKSNSKDWNKKFSEVIIKKQDSIPFDTTATDQLLRYYCLHQFSDPANKDIFSIALYGKSIDSGNIVFKITDHNHHRIYSETFPASDMLGDLIDDTAMRSGADTIKMRMANFLNSNSFHSPAIGSNEKVEDAFEIQDKSDIDNWKDIQSDRTSIAFMYFHGYESTYAIAYSKKKKKVVLIFYSD